MDCPLAKYDWHPTCSPKPRYTDGTEVAEGDRVRYRQAPGGMLPPSPEWKHGQAVVSKHCSGTLDLAADDGRTYMLLSHVIEREEHPYAKVHAAQLLHEHEQRVAEEA